MSRRFDLDAHRVGRAEVEQEPMVLVIDGQDYELPAELPFHVLDALGPLMRDDPTGFSTILESLLGEHWPEVKPKLSVEDGIAIVEGVLEQYQTSLGELLASRGSSPTTSPPSRPTSNGSTRSTSAKRAGGRGRSASAGLSRS